MVRRRKAETSKPVADAPPPRPAVSRAEWLTILCIVVLAAALRFAYPNRMAIEHFDEGVYASNIFFSEAEGGQYPYRHLYAPPLLPFLIEWGIIFLGPESIAPFLPALILGTATVPLAWWAVRSWFGPIAGLAAAWLIATSDFHILYSRTALTDVPVAFFILLAVFLYWEAVRRESLRWSIAAGVATGLAWWTKYTGWLPLAIAFAGSIAWIITEKRAADVSLLSRAKSVAACFATMAVVAFVVWSPVLWYLQPYGGYAAVAENHRGYLRPVSYWPTTLLEQLRNLNAQSGSMTAIGLGVIASTVPLHLPSRLRVRVPVAIWSGATTFYAAVSLGALVPLSLLATMSLIAQCRLFTSRSTVMWPEAAPFRAFAFWIILAWFAAMLVTTPLYYPFPRLALPWLIAALLAIGTLITPGLINAGPTSANSAVLFFGALLIMPAAILPTFISTIAGPSLALTWNAPAWEDRSGLMRAAEQVGDDFRISDERDGQHARSRRPAVIYVYGAPALFFHLTTQLSDRTTVILPAGDLSFAEHLDPGVDTYLAWGPGTGLPKESRPYDNPIFRLEYYIRERRFFPSILFRADREEWNGPGGHWSQIQLRAVRPKLH